MINYWRGLYFRVSHVSRIYAKIKSSRIKGTVLVHNVQRILMSYILNFYLDEKLRCNGCNCSLQITPSQDRSHKRSSQKPGQLTSLSVCRCAEGMWPKGKNRNIVTMYYDHDAYLLNQDVEQYVALMCSIIYFLKISYFLLLLFMPPDRMIRGILFLSCLIVCLFVCLFVCLLST